MKRVFWSLLIMTALFVAACSDDDGEDPKKNDGGTASDLAPKKDRSWTTLDDKGNPIIIDLPVTAGDLPKTLGDKNVVVGDLPQGTANCAAVFSCAKQCTAADTSCLPGCVATGCGSATDTVIEDFYACAMGTCVSDCMESFSSACETCLTTNCSSDLAACMSHSC